MCALLASTALVAAAGRATAVDSTWLGVVVGGSYHDPGNWTPAQVPDGTALFGPVDTNPFISTTTDLILFEPTTIGSWVFLSGAQNYTFHTATTLNFNGSGIVGSSDAPRPFIDNGHIINFNGNSSAGNVAILSQFTAVHFNDSSTAGTAIIQAIGNDTPINFFANSTGGDAAIVVQEGAVVRFFGNSTGGRAQLVSSPRGPGVIDFSGSSGPAGDNRLTAGSIEGAGSVLLGANLLTVGINGRSTEFSGVISGTGGLAKAGDSVFTLSGINTYTGPTLVNAGTLIVNGSIASSSGVTVNGGLLGGSGELPHVMLHGGRLAPGNSIGTITVRGDLAFGAGGVYEAEVTANEADRVSVTGTATLAGTVAAVFLPGSSVTRSHTILSAAGGLGGTAFQSVVAPPGFAASVSYTATDVMLSLTAQLGAGMRLAGNQSNVANAINTAFNGGAALHASFLPVFNRSGPALGNALTQLSGEPATGFRRAGDLSMRLFLNAMLDPLVPGRGGSGFGAAMAYAPEAALPTASWPGLSRLSTASFDAPKTWMPATSAGMTAERRVDDDGGRNAYAAALPVKAPPLAPSFEQRWSVWGSAYGGRNRLDSDAVVGSNDLSASTGGFAVGADYRVSPVLTLGAAVAIGETNWNVSGQGSGNSNLAQVGGYASARWNSFYLSAALAGAWHNVDTSRTITVAGLDALRADFDATAFGARVEGGWRHELGSFGLTPYAAVQMQSVHMPAYGELGTGAFALTYASQTATDTRTELGLWADTRHALSNGVLVLLRGRAAWVHDFDPDNRINAIFQTLPGASFTVNGAAAPRDAALLSGVGELRLANGVSFTARADGEFSGRGHSYAGTGTVRYRW